MAKEQSKLESNIWKYYIYSFLAYFVIFVPYLIYYFQKLGFSLAQIAIVNAVLSIVVFSMEIPSGYIADRIGRKNSLILSSFLFITSLILLYYANSFIVVLLSQIFNGLGAAFLSGADSALVYDTLLSLKREKEFKKIYGFSIFIQELAIILASLIGAWMIAFGFKLTVFYTIIFHVAMLLMSLLLIEPKMHKKLEPLPFKKEIKNLLLIVKKSIKYKKLLSLSIFSFVVLGFSNTIFLMYNPYFKETNLPLYSYGLIFAFFSIFTAFAGWKAHSIEEKIGVFKSLLIIPIFLVISFLGSSIFYLWWGFIFFMFREFVRGYVQPVISDYTHKLIQSSERATILSVQNMFSRLGWVVISIMFGYFSDAFGLRTILFMSGIVLLVFTLITVFMFKKYKNILD